MPDRAQNTDTEVLEDPLMAHPVKLTALLGCAAVALLMAGPVQLGSTTVDLGIAGFALALVVAIIGGSLALFSGFDLRWTPNPANPFWVGVAAALLEPAAGAAWALSEGGGLGLFLTRTGLCWVLGLGWFLLANRLIGALEELRLGHIGASSYRVRSRYHRCQVAIWVLPPAYLALGTLVLTTLGAGGWTGFIGRALLLGFSLHAIERWWVVQGLPAWRRRLSTAHHEGPP